MNKYRPLTVLGIGILLSAVPLAGAGAGSEPAQYGPAEAPEMVRPKIETSSTWVTSGGEVSTSEIVVSEPAPVDQPGSPADDPGPNTDPSITAPNTVDPNGAGMTFAPEGTPGCFDSVRDYLDLWHTTGIQPQAPCFVVPS